MLSLLSGLVSDPILRTFRRVDDDSEIRGFMMVSGSRVTTPKYTYSSV